MSGDTFSSTKLSSLQLTSRISGAINWQQIDHLYETENLWAGDLKFDMLMPSVKPWAIT